MSIDRPLDRHLAWALAADPRLAALVALDARLGAILRTTSQPLIGQMRLAWWREALGRIDRAPAPAEPVLRAIAATGLDAGGLATLVDGWDRLLADETMTAERLYAFAQERGGRLFALAATRREGADGEAIAAAGRAWALSDLARYSSRADEAAAAQAMAADCFSAAFARRWPAALRPLGMLALASRGDGQRSAVGLRLYRFRLTGR